MPLDNASRRFLAQAQLSDDFTNDIDGIRKHFKATHAQWDVPQVDVGSENDICIAGPSGPIGLRIYQPEEREPDDDFPIVAVFHGGGWIVGDLDSHDNFCRYLCRHGLAIVVSVDYRLAPEHKFPAAVEDCFAALTWISNCSKTLGGSVQKLCVAGDSAGGNLAAVMCHLAKAAVGPRIWKQLLFYPSVALSFDDSNYPSRQQYGSTNEFGLSNEAMGQFRAMYAPNSADHKDIRLSPILAKDFTNLPNALVIVAEYDLLRDEGRHYAMRLKDAGVTVQYSLYSGVLHGFMSQSGMIGRGLEALNEAAAFIGVPD